jgi:tRNA wybutosine-synthesizing protein 2
MAISQGKTRGCTAVDLYAGIGDFAFSYAAAGVQKVLCWDSDPWRIEGLRKGALRNNWKVQVHDNQLHPESTDFRISSKTKLVAFVESNEKALERIQILRDALPPIRHVNCGLLPTSRDCYATAAAALDPELGGWVHVHESFGVQEVTCKAKKIRVEFEELIKNLDKERGFSNETTARKPVVEHIQRVKTYGPGVLHCVVDIFVPPIHR